MNHYFVDVLLWSFSIYGFLSLVKEYWLEAVCYIIMKMVYILKLCKNYLKIKVDKTQR